MTADDDTLFDFPCRFPIKAMGLANNDIRPTVAALVREHAADVSDEDIQVTPSRNGKYVSVTVTITATSREQLDTIYLALNDHDAIVMTL
ncbi:hypothetical protein CAI21_01175 [Alkalilimnicola ehrlichii]|uniref:UPF0250 protein CAL65_01240 n=1 Tax=Alkalilimnicola ehrlichii TaxID=351052 RepID=A0A3E0X339_9GAMM|nr:DUF493 domain-containing protein [Alkalilimnicola ehrlichii]RFA31279.1 hypothetical protein CAI21_01175 [Alkalilimnicola ehrlichii]RFA39448.1 hypothetical protein CAL65_01240 [Alkalilimnicola ehrlichii]